MKLHMTTTIILIVLGLNILFGSLVELYSVSRYGWGALNMIPLGLFILQILFASPEESLRNCNKGILLILCIPLLLIGFVINQASWGDSINAMRWSFFQFVLFFVMLNKVPEAELKYAVKVIFFLCVLQIPLGVIKFFLWGSTENALGMLGHSSTSFFVGIAISFVLAYYLIKQINFLRFLVLFVGFSFCGFAGGKRALLLLIPLIMILEFMIYTYYGQRWKVFLRYLIPIVLVGAVFIYIFVRLIPTLNPEHTIWGTFEWEHLITMVENHTSTEQYSVNDTATGRTSALCMGMRVLQEDVSVCFFGMGPQLFVRDGSYDAAEQSQMNLLNIEYGINGFLWYGLQFGLPVAILVFLFFLLGTYWGVQAFRRAPEPFWKAYGLGMAMAGLIMSFFQYYYSMSKNFAITGTYCVMLGILCQYVRGLNASNKIEVHQSSKEYASSSSAFHTINQRY